jgi:hypothetical protein
VARVSRSLARWGSSKPFAEGLARFDLANCQAEVSLIAAARAGRVLEMKLPTGDGFDVTAQIRFTTTSVHFGGCRVWMICPRCCGRARVIFAGRGKIGCQRCLRLRYRSQCGDAKDRAHLAIAKIEKRLITRRGRFHKPKGVLWRMFHRLCDRYDHHDAVLNAGPLRAVARLRRRCEG